MAMRFTAKRSLLEYGDVRFHWVYCCRKASSVCDSHAGKDGNCTWKEVWQG